MQPDTRYAQSGDVNIAYQVLGVGPRDLVFVPGWVSNIEVYWEEPTLARFLTRLGSFSRLILFDKRGGGVKVTEARRHAARSPSRERWSMPRERATRPRQQSVSACRLAS